jgi:hypothetical protein
MVEYGSDDNRSPCRYHIRSVGATMTRTFIFASIQWTGFFIGVGGIGIAVFGRAIGII